MGENGGENEHSDRVVRRERKQVRFADVSDGPKIIERDFKKYQFEEVGAKGVTFEECDFSYSTFLRVYFRNASFIKCRFTGCDFEHCNLRGAKFSQCDFSYATFGRTHVDPDDLFTQLPKRPNVRREFAQVLGRNAESMGNGEAALQCFWFQMEQTQQYLLEAAEGREEYYKRKYPGFWNRVAFRFSYWSHVFSSVFWGHGESPLRLLRATSAILLLVALIFVFQSPSFEGPPVTEDPATAIGFAIAHTLLLMLGLTTEKFVPGTDFGAFLFGLGALTGYVLFGLFIVTLTRRYVKR